LAKVLIGTLGSQRQLPMALKLLKELPKRSYRCDAFSYSQAVKACEGLAEAWQEPLEILEMMKSSAVTLDEVTVGALLSTQSSSNKAGLSNSWGRSALYMASMAQVAIEANVIMFNSLMGSFGQDQWMESVHAMDDMASKFLRPNAFLYSTLLSCCVQAAKWTNALSLWLDVASRSRDAWGCRKMGIPAYHPNA
jgi:hypothetical protein